MAGAIQQGFLKGLKVTGAARKKVKDDDGNVKEEGPFRPFERAMKVDDVLCWALRDEGVVIVAVDGQKHVVEISAADRKKLEDELAKAYKTAAE